MRGRRFREEPGTLPNPSSPPVEYFPPDPFTGKGLSKAQGH